MQYKNVHAYIPVQNIVLYYEKYVERHRKESKTEFSWISENTFPIVWDKNYHELARLVARLTHEF